ncbi:hypothetical protein [Micromonospora haikouensis]|uniref:hypothetical protein n=1 Tax=Micromonospora haikouensis TaxID=686309 RepID=UPI003D724BA2
MAAPDAALRPVPEALVNRGFEAARTAVKAGGYTPSIADNHLLLVGVTAALGELIYDGEEPQALRCSRCGTPVSAPTLPIVVSAWLACTACLRADIDEPEELRMLRAQVAELREEVPHLVSMGPGGDGHFQVVIRRGPRLVEAMGAALRDLLDEHAGENYFETDLAFGDGTHCKAIFVRPDGLSPHELRRRAEEERDEAVACVNATRQMANAANERLRTQLLAALGREDDGKTPLSEYVAALVADRDRLAAQLAALDVGEQRHIVDLRAGGWTLQHPIACRPNLVDCPVNRAAERDLAAPAVVPGRYVVEVNDLGDRLLIFDRVD